MFGCEVNTEKKNKYDFFLFLLVAFLCFGSIGGAFQPCRVLVLLLSPFLINRMGDLLLITKKVFVWSFFLFMYGAISLLWTPDTTEGIKQLVYLFVHLLLFFEIIIFSRYANKPITMITSGWLFLVIICCSIGIWELATGSHLDIARERSDVDNYAGVIISRLYSNSTFGNYNTFVTVLCFSFPWLFACMTEDRMIKKILAVFAILIVTVLSLLNASRGGVLSIALMFMIYLFSITTDRINRVFFLLLLAGAIVLYYQYGDILFTTILARANNGGLLEDNTRLEIWVNAYNCIVDTMGFGVGIGGMEMSMNRYANGGVNITHNLTLEIFVIYGFVFAVAYVWFMIKMFIKGLKKNDGRKTIILMTIATMPIYTIINSGYLGLPQLFAHIATIYVFVNYERLKSPCRILR